MLRKLATTALLCRVSRPYIRSFSSRMSLIDVDCNLWHDDLRTFASKLDPDADTSSPFSILEHDALEELDIKAMISPCSTIREAEVYLPMLEQAADLSMSIKTTIGLHPYQVNDENVGATLDDLVPKMTDLLTKYRSLCSAVGECGLDASEGFPPIQDQIPWFKAQVEVAEKLQLPIFVHERLSFTDILQILRGSSVPIIIHCFTGTRDECVEYIKRGYFVSLSGYIFRDDAEETRLCLKEGLIPLDRLMIETDAPYLGFQGCRDRYLAKHKESIAALKSKKKKSMTSSIYPNLPSALPSILEKVLDLINEGRRDRGENEISRDELARITTQNANTFFHFGLNLD